MFVLAAVCPPTAVWAQTPTLLVDTGPGANTALALIPSNVANGNFQFIAGRFTLTTATSIDSVEGWMGPVFAGNMVVHIRSDANGLPGSSVFSKSYSMLAASDTNWRSFANFNIDLGAGSYWLAFEPSSAFSSMPTGVTAPLEKYAIYFAPNNGYRDMQSGTLPSGALPSVGVRLWGTAGPSPTLLSDTGAGANTALALIPSNVANGNFQYLAGRFTLTVATSVESVEGWMGPVFAGDMQVHIRSDANGLPGNSVFSKTYPMVSASDTNWRAFPNFKIDLSAGSYWLSFEPSSAFSSMPTGVTAPLEKYAIYFAPNGGYRDMRSVTLPSGALPSVGVRVWGIASPPPCGSLCPPPPVDLTPPAITCAPPDGLWHNNNISLPCTAQDAGVGLANAADASFNLSTSVAAGVETANASTGSRQVCDAANNCASAGPIAGNMIDRKAPVVTPPANQTVTQTQAGGAVVSWPTLVITDQGSGVASSGCIPASGSLFPVGTSTVTCTATDAAGNSATASFRIVVTAQAQTGFYQVFSRAGAQAGCWNPSNPDPWQTDYHEEYRGTPPHQPGFVTRASATASAGGSSATGSIQTDLMHGTYNASFSGNATVNDDNCAGTSALADLYGNAIDDLFFSSASPAPITVTFSISGTQSLGVQFLHPEDRTEPFEEPFIVALSSNSARGVTSVTGDAYNDGFGNAILRMAQGSQSGQWHVTAPAPGPFRFRVYFEAVPSPGVNPWATIGQPYSYSGSASASFRLDSLPPGVTCTSASGAFPGCGNTPPPPPPPPDENVDLSIANVRVEQVVYDPDINNDNIIDLVANKPAVALVKVKATNVKAGDSRTFRVSAVIAGEPFLSDSVVLSNIPADGKDVEVYFAPTTPGQATLTASVDSIGEIAESDEQNNSSSPMALDVTITKALGVTYVRFDDCRHLLFGCYGSVSVDEAFSTRSKSDELIRATFPTADYASNLSAFPVISPNTAGFIPSDDLALLTDIWLRDTLQATIYGRLTFPDKSKIIGLVPTDYFKFFARQIQDLELKAKVESVKGISMGGVAGLAMEGTEGTVAHELGHLFGIPGGDFEEYLQFPGTDYLGNPAPGFSIREKAEVVNGICFMGRATVGPDHRHWVDKPHYEQLFRSLLPASAADPELLMVSGLLYRDGRVELQPLHYLPSGFATESTVGEYAVRVLDAGGHVISKVSMPGDFVVNLESVGGVPTDVIPFLVTVPYPQTSVAVEIVGPGNTVLARVRASTQTLLDGIKAIPDFGFRDQPSQHRSALLNKATAIDRAVARGGTKGAVQNLFYDLRNYVWAWLIDGYVKTEPTQLQKEEVIALIDAMGIRLVSGGS